MTLKKFKNNLLGYVNGGFEKDKQTPEIILQAKDMGQKEKPVSYLSLFRYSTLKEKAWIVFAIILAILSGCIPPIINVLYGEFCNLMIDRQFPTDLPSIETFFIRCFGGGKILQNASSDERRIALEADARAFGLGCGFFTLVEFLCAMTSVFLLSFVASKQIARIKILFFKSVLCKDLAWFDTQMDINFAGKASDNLNKVEAGIGGVVAIFTFLLVIFTFGIGISLVYGWKLTLAILSLLPISFGTSSAIAKVQSKLTVKEMEAYAKAGTVAEEVFTSIRTVVAFEGEQKEIERYSQKLEESRHYGIKKGKVSGISNGIMWLVIYCSYAVVFMYGVRLMQDSRRNNNDDYTPAVLLIVFFGVVTALTNIGFAAAHIETFAVARGAATSVFNTISLKTEINPCSEEGDEIEDFKGEIEFKNVHFEYPARPSVNILKGLNLKIKAGEIVALVGGSGAGKSTVLQLVQRLYDPSQGEIFLDEKNIKSLKVSWIRNQLGVVGQEPQLFNTTIRENILYGHLLATDEDIVEAARKANAHGFIMKLRDDYNTVVGQKGSTLSGGQKQRIAIARALVRDPKILILDEATSALDTTSEKIVQAALDEAAKGRTTLIVTHKLSTITNVDRIIVLRDGVVAEDGTHDELIQADGLYKELLQAQETNVKETKKPDADIPVSQIPYEDPLVVPPGPQSRFASVSRSVKSANDLLKKINTQEPHREAGFSKIFEWSKPELWLLIVGFASAVVGGAALPTVCVLFGDLSGLLSLTDFDEMLRQTDVYGVFLLVVAVMAGVSAYFQINSFTTAGAKLTTRLKEKAFRCMIYQDIGYFDKEKNKVGALCLRLAQDPTKVHEVIGNRLGILLQAISTITIGTVISFFFNWEITLVTLATIPFVFSGVALEAIFARRISNLENKSSENSLKIAVEVISNIKVVASLNRESYFAEKYAQAVREGKNDDVKKSWLKGFTFAIGQTAPFFAYALCLWYGGLLVANENLHYKYVVMISELLIFGAWTMGQCVVSAPGFGEAKAAAARLNYIYMKTPAVTDGTIVSPPNMKEDGVIEYSKVNFAYPSRPGVKVLHDFNLNIPSGKSIAVVGPSGSGKSTVVQLLQRLYDPISGRISINDVDIKQYKLTALRKTLGLVGQEPVLFDKSIKDNIAYGDNSRVVRIDEIIDAAKAANIHSFITSLPNGYDTTLGISGAQLSGGQKQRIAIARALVRNPQILLLDEATSALDPQSESLVQEALDKASAGRTTITIAHRLSAMKNADTIYVVVDGVIRESGTHEELMSKKGVYFSLHGGVHEEQRPKPSETESESEE